MILVVTCGICNAELIRIEKDQVTNDDINTYQQDCSCDTDGQANIQVEVTS